MLTLVEQTQQQMQLLQNSKTTIKQEHEYVTVTEFLRGRDGSYQLAPLVTTKTISGTNSIFIDVLPLSMLMEDLKREASKLKVHE